MMPCDSPPSGVNSLLLLHFAGPLTPSALRFWYVTPRVYLFQRDQRLAAVVSLVGHYLRDSVDIELAASLPVYSRLLARSTPPLPRRLRPAFRALWWCRPDPPLAASPRSPPHFPCPPHAPLCGPYACSRLSSSRYTHLRRSRSSGLPCSTLSSCASDPAAPDLPESASRSHSSWPNPSERLRTAGRYRVARWIASLR